MRRLLVISLILVAVIAASFGALRITAQEKEPPPPDFDTITVVKGDILSTVSATGAIEPEDEVTLVFKTIGRVAEVLVAQGEEVQPDQVLARLETADLDLALAQSMVNLAISQAQLAKLKAGADEVDIKAAQASVDSAKASVESARAAAESARAAYNDLLAGPTADEQQAVAASLERARIIRDQAQAAYDQVAHLPNVGLLPQSMQLQQATVDYEVAAANYRVATAAPKASQLAAARAQIAQADAALAQAEAALASAQSNLERLLKGPSAEDLTIAEAQVTQAQLGVQQARLAAENSELVSPIQGVVTQVNIRPGELPNSARPAFVVTDISRFHIDIAVDEIDITKLREGQPVKVTLDALPAADLTGHIDFISPTPTSLAGVVSYAVTVVIDEANVPLRSGLSATASIIVEELNDVLVVPNRAIQIDRSSGRAFVERVEQGVPVRTEIEIGSRNETQSQILRGLKEGDLLAIRSGTGLDRLRNTFFGQ